MDTVFKTKVEEKDQPKEHIGELMNLTHEEKQFIIQIMAQSGLNFQDSETRRAIVQKLQLPPVKEALAKEEKK